MVPRTVLQANPGWLTNVMFLLLETKRVPRISGNSSKKVSGNRSLSGTLDKEGCGGGMGDI